MLRCPSLTPRAQLSTTREAPSHVALQKSRLQSVLQARERAGCCVGPRAWHSPALCRRSTWLQGLRALKSSGGAGLKQWVEPPSPDKAFVSAAEAATLTSDQVGEAPSYGTLCAPAPSRPLHGAFHLFVQATAASTARAEPLPPGTLGTLSAQVAFLERKRKAAAGLGPIMPEGSTCPACNGVGEQRAPRAGRVPALHVLGRLLKRDGGHVQRWPWTWRRRACGI